MKVPFLRDGEVRRGTPILISPTPAKRRCGAPSSTKPLLRRRSGLIAAGAGAGTAGATRPAGTAAATPSSHAPEGSGIAQHATGTADIQHAGNENAFLELAASHHVVPDLDVGEGDAFALL